MRTIQVFVLRLLVDPENPQVLRGSLQNVAEAETLPFADEQALLILLHRALRINLNQEFPNDEECEESPLPP